jgi:hypothetical protein
MMDFALLQAEIANGTHKNHRGSRSVQTHRQSDTRPGTAYLRWLRRGKSEPSGIGVQAAKGAEFLGERGAGLGEA